MLCWMWNGTKGLSVLHSCLQLPKDCIEICMILCRRFDMEFYLFASLEKFRCCFLRSYRSRLLRLMIWIINQERSSETLCQLLKSRGICFMGWRQESIFNFTHHLSIQSHLFPDLVSSLCLLDVRWFLLFLLHFGINAILKYTQPCL